MSKKRPVYIELIGIGLPNRGAELLARAVMQSCNKQFGNCIFATAQKLPEPELKKLGIKRCLKNGAGRLQSLLSTLKTNRLTKSQRRPSIYRAFSWLPREQRDRLDIVLEQDVDLVIDASGFAYGDYWGSAKAQRRLEDRRAGWQAQNKPLVFLPQSFGPFDTDGFKTSLKPSLDCAACVCVRDRQSAQYLVPFIKKARLYPDITFLLDCGTSLPATKPYSLFIPNNKVLEAGAVDHAEYISVAREFIRLSRQLNVEPIMLNHEGVKDLAICQQLSDLDQVRVLNPADALLIKAYIAGAEFVFSSRYHGVVSSLATETPVVVFGWSHKYRELLQDFGLEHWLIDDIHQASKVLGEFCAPPALAEIRGKINGHLPWVRQQLNEMWRWIFSSVHLPRL
ncbi:polysaccharide pyruvyl transferase family protein [Pontibacter sp. JAM-7]|uniref:polysaccharide pyruvyl transferase family protein n=1 Tax=Pontibacter sp. JAM-7 TaxID=3366581 RepID=UPI003AF8A6B4